MTDLRLCFHLSSVQFLLHERTPSPNQIDEGFLKRKVKPTYRILSPDQPVTYNTSQLCFLCPQEVCGRAAANADLYKFIAVKCWVFSSTSDTLAQVFALIMILLCLYYILSQYSFVISGQVVAFVLFLCQQHCCN